MQPMAIERADFKIVMSSSAPLIIPARTTSKYAGQYAGADAERVAEIVADSYKLALTSRDPQFCGDRCELAVEAYHQLMEASPSLFLAAVVTASKSELCEKFPLHLDALRDGTAKGESPAEVDRTTNEIENAALPWEQRTQPELPKGMG